MGTVRRFVTYDPYLTFSDPLNESFLTYLDSLESDEDITALFGLGRDAYSRFPSVPSQEDLEEMISAYFEFIEGMRQALKKFELRWSRSSDNDDIEIYWSTASDEDILQSILRDHLRLSINSALLKPRLLRKIFLVQVLVEIDNTIFLKAARKPTIRSALAAAYALSRATALEMGEGVAQSVKTDFAYRGVNAWKDRDPKQKEKKFVFECWQQWQKAPHSYPSKAAFARDMLTKCELLTSQKKIEDWCRDWEAKMEPIGLGEHSSGPKLTSQE
ncbi:hypothetical protein [Nitrosospira sp. Is2]|uniref:hypothetical protein n=1 Tax=Nitrosospira sp. Is2 TaxID=3080532 RepID=UPI002954C00A|nr:hypothetical protein [Nitrosospira sp. Is2]WON74236.1 hypothetical protein R5L00_01735 [Nitrosospira sp. Is2]